MPEIVSLEDSHCYFLVSLSSSPFKFRIHVIYIDCNTQPCLPTCVDTLLVKAELTNKQFLEECRELLLTLVDREPLLQYHLSLVHAMLGHGESSKKSWSRFMERFM